MGNVILRETRKILFEIWQICPNARKYYDQISEPEEIEAMGILIQKRPCHNTQISAITVSSSLGDTRERAAVMTEAHC